MKNIEIDGVSILQHFRTELSDFILARKGGVPIWSDREFHETAYGWNPALYALCSVYENTREGQRARVLFQILSASRKGMTIETRSTLERVVSFLLAVLHPDIVLTVFLALRRTRANHKHVSRAILGYLLNNPGLEDMAAQRGATLRECFEHALGINTMRACVKEIKDCGDSEIAEKKLLKFTFNKERGKAVLAFIYGKKALPAHKRKSYLKVHKKHLPEPKGMPKRPNTVTATNRGDISATLVHIYRGGANQELMDALDNYVKEAAQGMPWFSGRMAMMLDATESTRGYGEREFCCVSQSVAFMKVLAERVSELKVRIIGGAGDIPAPIGDTDLASALLDSLEENPDLLVIVSDGYENVNGGDLKRLIAALPGAGIRTPVVYCSSKFTHKDDLKLRRPAVGATEMEFWHQLDFEDIFLSLFYMAEIAKGEKFLREHMLSKLYRFEMEAVPWTIV